MSTDHLVCVREGFYFPGDCKIDVLPGLICPTL